MATTTKIDIASFAFSTLLGDNADSPTDQEGFLFGNVYTQEKLVITDHVDEAAKETKIIRITSHMHLLKICDFFSTTGDINSGKLSAMLKHLNMCLIGYFDFKRMPNSENWTRPSMRMRRLFKNLNKWAAEHQKSALSQNELILMILRQNHAANSTVNNAYCFYQLKSSGKLEKTASEIPNLEDTTHRQYISSPSIQAVEQIIAPVIGPAVPLENLKVVLAHGGLKAEVEKVSNDVNRELVKKRSGETAISTLMKDITLTKIQLEEAKSLYGIRVLELKSASSDLMEVAAATPAAAAEVLSSKTGGRVSTPGMAKTPRSRLSRSSLPPAMALKNVKEEPQSPAMDVDDDDDDHIIKQEPASPATEVSNGDHGTKFKTPKTKKEAVEEGPEDQECIPSTPQQELNTSVPAPRRTTRQAAMKK